MTKRKPLNGIFFKEQAEALKRMGHDVVIAFPEMVSLKEVFNSKEMGITIKTENGVKTYRHKGYYLYPGIKSMAKSVFFKRLLDLYKLIILNEGKPDIIHAHSCLWGGWAAARLSKITGIPLVITEHSSVIGKKVISEGYKKNVAESLNHASKVIVVGDDLKSTITDFIPAEKVEVIPNIVNIDKFKLVPAMNKRKKFRFFSLAFLTHNKGMDILIKAFAKSFRNNEDVELVIGGAGNEEQNLKRLTMDLSIENKISFIGELDRAKVIKEMQQSDVFVLASRYETFGVVYIEALSCGKPIIATACGGPNSIVNEINGLIVPVEDIDSLSEAMVKIKNSYSDYNSDLIREDCIRRFSEKAVIRKLEIIYKSITNN